MGGQWMALLQRIKIALGQGGRDLGKTFRGLVTFFQYLSVSDDLDVGLGWLSARSLLARRGQASEYVVRMANTAWQPQKVTLTIEIAAAHVSKPAAGPYAFFGKSLILPPRISWEMTIGYDWMTHAGFQIDGILSPPDAFSRGVNDAPSLYALTVFLSNRLGKRLDGLTVYQELVE
jgi:hypothetical protein